MPTRQLASTFIALLLLAGCAAQPTAKPEMAQAACPAPQPCPVCPVCPTVEPPMPPKPPAKPLQEARWEDVAGWREDNLAEAHGALLVSCGALEKQPLWAGVCGEGARCRRTAPPCAVFFESRFRPGG
ncbi:MAG: hypothetical protein M5R42_15930 [Rhodocyclaceae bacterium]|nr:hypothetical protein [Rhodocyclaceae bacterium]